MHSFASSGRGSPGLPWLACRPFLGTIMTGDAHVLIVHWIIPASNSFLSVLSTQGLNLRGIVYGADIHGGPSVEISTGGCVIVLIFAEHICIVFN